MFRFLLLILCVFLFGCDCEEQNIYKYKRLKFQLPQNYGIEDSNAKFYDKDEKRPDTGDRKVRIFAVFPISLKSRGYTRNYRVQEKERKYPILNYSKETN